MFDRIYADVSQNHSGYAINGIAANYDAEGGFPGRLSFVRTPCRRHVPHSLICRQDNGVATSQNTGHKTRGVSVPDVATAVPTYNIFHVWNF